MNDIRQNTIDNDFLEFYGKHGISPVHQNISDIELHFKRRRKLYRQCGMPLLTFRNADVLEVGPGGGYNTLAFFEFGAHVDLVEANPTGVLEMKELFTKRGISSSSYKIYQGKIEEYSTEKKYDIIIAEGFLHCLKNRLEIIRIIDSLLKTNGIVVVTCADCVGLFIESMKRVFATFLTRDICDFESKVQYLTRIFEPQLKKLRGMSRPVRDWVQDTLLNPAMVNGVTFSFADAINAFGESYHVLGSSPQIFFDGSWYKDVEFSQHKIFMQEFCQRQFSMVLAGHQEIVMEDMTYAKKVESFFHKMKELADWYDDCQDTIIIQKMKAELLSISPIIERMKNDTFSLVFRDVCGAISDISENTVEFNRYPHFFSAFGKGMQYIAFEKGE